MFNRTTKCLSFITTLLLVGCVSSPQVSNYYLIDSVTQKKAIDSDQRIILSPVELSPYLQSSNLHVKSNDGEIIYSSTDLWAEPLNKMLWRSIEQSLEQQLGRHVLASYETSISCAQIKIRIDELSPSINGQVSSNGRWFINKGKTRQETNKFSFNGNIDTDGYTASNKVIAKHMNELSIELAQKIRTLNLCQK